MVANVLHEFAYKYISMQGSLSSRKVSSDDIESHTRSYARRGGCQGTGLVISWTLASSVLLYKHDCVNFLINNCLVNFIWVTVGFV